MSWVGNSFKKSSVVRRRVFFGLRSLKHLLSRVYLFNELETQDTSVSPNPEHIVAPDRTGSAARIFVSGADANLAT